MANVSYNIGIHAYKTGIKIARLLGNEKAEKWIKGRKGWEQELTDFRASHQDRPLIWFHASSLGEFEQVKPLIERIKQDTQYDDYLLFVTFFSPSGYDNSQGYSFADKLFYLPLDTPSNSKKFVELLNPDIAVFVKYDFWFNFLDALQQKVIPTLFFSCNFRKNQLFFKPYAKWQLSILQNITKILTLNEASVKVLENHGVKGAEVCGDTRFDRVIDNAKKQKNIPEIERFKNNKKLLVLGSSWQPEEKILADYLTHNKGCFSSLKIIIAPHDIAENHLKEIEKIIPEPVVRFSQLKTNKDNFNYNVLLIDNIGLLSSIYRYSEMAFIGGGFTNDLHNILEPASFGNAVLFGNKHSKYPEGQELIEYEGAKQITDALSFSTAINRWLKQPNELKDTGTKARDFIYRHQGATDIVFNNIKKLL